MVRKRQIEARAEQVAKAAKSTAQTVLADPMLVAAGIHVIRAIGVKKLIPILAVGGLALGFLASRSSASETSEAPQSKRRARRRMAEHGVLRMQGRSCAAAHPRHCKRIEIHHGLPGRIAQGQRSPMRQIDGVIG
jgi:hypothetical protein